MIVVALAAAQDTYAAVARRSGQFARASVAPLTASCLVASAPNDC